MRIQAPSPLRFNLMRLTYLRIYLFCILIFYERICVFYSYITIALISLFDFPLRDVKHHLVKRSAATKSFCHIIECAIFFHIIECAVLFPSMCWHTQGCSLVYIFFFFALCVLTHKRMFIGIYVFFCLVCANTHKDAHWYIYFSFCLMCANTHKDAHWYIFFFLPCVC